MGMDATANVFYGYKASVYLPRDDEDELLPMPKDIAYVNQCDEQFLAVECTNQHFDWDRSPQKLNLYPIQNSDYDAWNQILKQACEALDVEFKEINCGWFVTCDYR